MTRAEGGVTMSLMTTPKRPRLSFQISEEDKAQLVRLLALVPTMQEGRSIVLRVALRIGMAELEKDPNRILTDSTPRPDESSALGNLGPTRRASRDQNRRR